MASPPSDELANVELFADLSVEERQTIAQWLDIEEFASGQQLTKQGAAGYAFFVVRGGELDVSIDGATVRTLSPDDFFGEISILYGGRRTATVTASTPVTVWSMVGTRFRELQRDEPAIAATIEQTAAARLGGTPSPG